MIFPPLCVQYDLTEVFQYFDLDEDAEIIVINRMNASLSFKQKFGLLLLYIATLFIMRLILTRVRYEAPHTIDMKGFWINTDAQYRPQRRRRVPEFIPMLGKCGTVKMQPYKKIDRSPLGRGRQLRTAADIEEQLNWEIKECLNNRDEERANSYDPSMDGPGVEDYCLHALACARWQRMRRRCAIISRRREIISRKEYPIKRKTERKIRFNDQVQVFEFNPASPIVHEAGNVEG